MFLEQAKKTGIQKLVQEIRRAVKKGQAQAY
jgi:hypothetical protein